MAGCDVRSASILVDCKALQNYKKGNRIYGINT